MKTSQKTYSMKLGEIKKDWYVVDATDLILGRMSSEIALILRGKNKPSYTPHLDMGDNVIVINADKIALTGNKVQDKKYYWHTGYPGGIREINVEKQLEKKPENVVRKAVERMISRNPLGRQQMRNLYIYAGTDHPHAAQQPKNLDIAAKNPKNKRTKKN